MEPRLRLELEKVSIGYGCPRQNAIQKKGLYVIVTGIAWIYYYGRYHF